MTLEKECAGLEAFVCKMIEATKKETITNMVAGGVPVTTIYRFRYSVYNRPLAVTSVTLLKIAEQLDRLNKGATYADDLKNMVSHFVKTYIIVEPLSELNEKGLNYKTLRKIQDYTMESSYYLYTLKDYAQKIEKYQKGGMVV